MESETDLPGRAGDSRPRDREWPLHLRGRWRGMVRRVIAGITLCLPMAGAASAVTARSDSPARAVKGLRITAVEGDSWLRHLGSTFIASNMGRAGSWAAGPPSNTLEQSPKPQGSDASIILSGADLYRLSCQSCHKADGSGVPNEINSLLGPVQATSALMIRTQMKRRGVELDAKTVAKLVTQATAAVHARLQNGGAKMPPFGQLAPEEMQALLLFLDSLVGIPGERRQIWLSEPADRVGELVVKGTCHICHEAVGPGLGVGVATTASIPSLASLPKDRSRSEVIRKVRQGLAKPTPMMTSSRGQMPIFAELTPEEVAAAYDYLVRYPPRP